MVTLLSLRKSSNQFTLTIQAFSRRRRHSKPTIEPPFSNLPVIIGSECEIFAVNLPQLKSDHSTYRAWENWKGVGVPSPSLSPILKVQLKSRTPLWFVKLLFLIMVTHNWTLRVHLGYRYFLQTVLLSCIYIANARYLRISCFHDPFWINSNFWLYYEISDQILSDKQLSVLLPLS